MAHDEPKTYNKDIGFATRVSAASAAFFDPEIVK